MNQCWMIGRLTRDPEIRTTNGGKSVCNVTIAIDDNVKQGDVWVKKVLFLDVTVWGARGEAFAKYHSKGSLCSFTGKLEMDEWEDKTTKQKRTKIKMSASEWSFVGGPKEAHDVGVGDNVDNTPF